MVMQVKRKHFRHWGTFDYVNTLFMLIIMLVMLYPFWYVIMASFSSMAHVQTHGVLLYPDGLRLAAYRQIFTHNLIPGAYKNTIFITFAGTAISMVLTILGAYCRSVKTLPGRTVLTLYVVFTMWFGGGLVPTFLVVNSLGLVDSLWALILPGAISAYNMILMRNFFQNVPVDLYEAAEIDGITRLGYMVRILLPLSTASIATISLFYAVGYWNSYFNSVIYIRSMDKWTMQMLLHQMLKGSTELTNALYDNQAEINELADETMKCAMIVITITPILIVYPFIQKYFVKGVMVGSLKG